MKKSPNALEDQIIGHTLSIGSAVSTRIPPIGRLVNGAHPTSEALSFVPTRWRVARTPVADVKNWVELEGNHAAGLFPSRYHTAALLGVNRQELDDLQDEISGRPAVAYALGSVMMVGAMPEGETFGLSHPDEKDYRVAMRLGRGPLVATVGVWSPETREFTSPATDVKYVNTVDVHYWRPPTTVPLF